MVRNVSAGGMIIEIPAKIAPDTPVHLLLQTRRGSLEVEARVVWAAAAEGTVRHGLAFTQPQDHDFAIDLFIGESR